MPHTWEEDDWILVSTGWSQDFELKTNLQCDLCDRHIPAFILCEICKNNKESTVQREEEPFEKKEIDKPVYECEICGKKDTIWFSCEFCKKKLCQECKFGDQIVRSGIQCCDEKKNTTNPYGVVRKSHQTLFKEFLALY